MSDGIASVGSVTSQKYLHPRTLSCAAVPSTKHKFFLIPERVCSMGYESILMMADVTQYILKSNKNNIIDFSSVL